MCNLPWSRGASSLREQPGYEYTLEGAEDHGDTFIHPYFDNYGNPAGPYDIPESVPLFTDNDYSVPQPPARVPVVRPREHSPHRVDPYAGGFRCQLRDPLPDTVNEFKKKSPKMDEVTFCMLHITKCDTCYGNCFLPGRYDSFEGLRAEECGILNGCENGRCVRVREGYTCDCFDGYEFDIKKMACIGGRLDGPHAAIGPRGSVPLQSVELKHNQKQHTHLTVSNEPKDI